MSTSLSLTARNRVREKIARRILPFVFVLYLIAYLDRANVAFAKLPMTAALGFSEAVFGFGAGIFFLGYFLLEIPGALIVERWSARKWIARILITWGICTVLVGFVRTSSQFYLTRFLLGTAEAGFFPGVIVYLTHWFVQRDRGRAMSGFLIAIPVSLTSGAAISALVLRLHWFGLDGWRWVFILQGIPAVLFGFITLFYLTDHPRQARWLEREEREWIAAEIDQENQRQRASGHVDVLAALRQRNVVLLSLSLFFANIGAFAFVLWLSTSIQKASGFSVIVSTACSALPFGAALLSVILFGRSSDRTGERKLHAAVPLALAALFFVLSTLPGQPLFVVIIWLCLTGGAAYGWTPSFWVLPTLTLTESAAAASIGLINSIGGLGAFVGPSVTGYLLSNHYSYRVAVGCLSASFLTAAVLVLLVRVPRDKAELSVRAETSAGQSMDFFSAISQAMAQRQSLSRKRLWKRCFLLSLAVACSALRLPGAVHIIPTPQHFEAGNTPVFVTHGGTIEIILGPLTSANNQKLKLAADFLRRDLEQADSSLKIEIDAGNRKGAGGVRIYLWDYGVSPEPGAGLTIRDRSVLTAADHYGQSYVVRTPDAKSLWIVGSTDQGVLLGAMSALQLIEKAASGVRIQSAYVRDYPDFRYRTAADWLTLAEINGWSLDWGQGVDGFRRLCERELDEALRFKINMVFFDGFGWGLKQRFGGYGDLMRGLNQYARARGIHLEFGGYGARYGIVDAGMSYLGEAWKNRDSYPNGPTYQCMGSEMGTCRANDHLNHLKAEELREFVRTVEPGALYIHHEDVGLNKFEPMWKKRDERCRKRWPNDSITALNGAVGALAHLDSELVEAISSVKNPDGYDAARDCVIILVSPGYGPDSMSSADWSNTLAFWTNYSSQLPLSDNVLICFGGSSISAIFPPPDGGKGWIDLFDARTAQQGIHVGSLVYFVGGAEHFYTDYPLTGTPALTPLYYGATAMYYSTGNFYEKPLEVINAEYSWNRHSTGVFADPKNYEEAMHLNLAYVFAKNYPPEIFGPGGIFQRACALLYGPKAGSIMQAYYKESQWVPETQPENSELKTLKWYLDFSALPTPSHYEVLPWVSSATGGIPKELTVPEGDYLPFMWNRVYAVPERARDLVFDSKTWNGEIDDRIYATRLAPIHIDAQELHRRLARRWAMMAELNSKGQNYIDQALKADPLPGSKPGLEFLKLKMQVDQPLLEALADFHQGMRRHYAAPKDGAFREDLRKALSEAKQADESAARAFPHPIDPVGGSQPYGPSEVEGIQTFSKLLVQSIERQLQ